MLYFSPLSMPTRLADGLRLRDAFFSNNAEIRPKLWFPRFFFFDITFGKATSIG
jgi:hypothetical protein